MREISTNSEKGNQMTNKTLPRWYPSERLSRAFELARLFHMSDPRKGTDIPYLSHLMAVSALVMEHGGTETQAAAALLHDSIEDTEATFESLSVKIGEGIAQIVRDCSDTETEPGKKKEEWIVRKQRYIDRLNKKNHTDPSILVALADKVHNAESSVSDTRGMDKPERENFFDTRFNAKWPEQKWWYTELTKVFDEKVTDAATRPLVERLRRACIEIFDVDPLAPTPTK